MLWSFTLIIVGFIVIVTAIYLPVIDNTCNGYCCNSNQRAIRQSNDNHTIDLPFQIQKSDVSLSSFARNADKNHITPNALFINERMFSGVSTFHIPHQPIYNLLRTAALCREHKTQFTYIHKNKFPVVTVCGKTGTREEIYNTVVVSECLAQPEATIIMNGVTQDSEAWAAWSKLVADGVVHFYPEKDMYEHREEKWVKGEFKQVNTNKCVGEYVAELFHRVLARNDKQETSPNVTHYVISKEKEDELRRAYANDNSFQVTNITSVYHAAVLKVMFPTINIHVPLDDKDKDKDKDDDDDNDPSDLSTVIAFLKQYILI